MSIVDAHREKPMMVQTTMGQIYLTKGFTIENRIPFDGMCRITDGDYVYWLNFDNIVWIGPRE